MSSLGTSAVKESATAQFPLLEQQLRLLNANKDKWLSVSLDERVAILEEMRLVLWSPGFAQEMVHASCRAKGFDPLDPTMAPLVAEEWLIPGAFAWTLTERIRILKASKIENGAIKLPTLPVTEKNGRKVVKTFPSPLSSALEATAFTGFSVEVVLQEGKPATQGAQFKQEKGRVCLVLAAGNVDVGGALDCICKLYTENQVCMVKYNPVNEHCAFFSDKLLQPLIKRGFVCTTKGGMPESSFLTSHPLVDSMHLTGSDKTYSAIVWGGGAQQSENLRAGRRVNTKPFTCELGAVSPYIIAPGTEAWPESALLHHAKALAVAAAMNGGFICASPKAVILPASWPQRARFMELVEQSFKSAGGHSPYYPGADTRQAQFMQKYPSSHKVIASDWNAPKALPHVVISNVPAKEGEYALKNEAWTQVLAEVPIDAPLDQFLAAAVDVANNKKVLWGTLSATLVAGPSVPQEQVDAALINLRYGAVGLNVWGGFNFLFPSGLWGGYPGARPEDIQSGVEMVNNAYQFDHPEKAILRTPFISPNHVAAQKPSPLVSQRMLWFLTYPSLATFTKVVSALTVGL